MWSCTDFRHPTDEQLGHVDIYFFSDYYNLQSVYFECSMLSININYPKKVNPKSFNVTDNTIGFRPQTARVVLLFRPCNWEL